MGTRDPRVDAYIARSADFARPLLAAIREAAHAALPGMREDIKWGAPAFMQDGIVAIMASFKQHCALNFWRGKELVGDARNSEAMGQFGALKSPADLPPRRELVRLFKDAARLNASGAPAPARKPKPPPKVPPDLAAALAKNAPARKHWQAFTPGKQRDYVDWLEDAKRPETRAKRLATAVEWIAEGKPRHWKYQRC